MALGGRLPGDRHTLYLLSDDNNNATQTTRLYALSVRLPDEARLTARALLSATAYQPGPTSGTKLPPDTVNGVTPPFAGQPVPGFSAVIPAGARSRSADRLLAMPDNGFGSKDNSPDFLLRAYFIEPDYRDHRIRVRDHLDFRDPERKVPFPIVNQDTRDRLLTGADFDVESLARDARGDLWIGEEFGPYLVRTDGTGKVLQAPIPLPDGTKSPQSPDLTPGRARPCRPAAGSRPWR
ncbi:esterase-like activity of phytase family protein [Nonomuraea antimicrobica]